MVISIWSEMKQVVAVAVGSFTAVHDSACWGSGAVAQTLPSARDHANQCVKPGTAGDTWLKWKAPHSQITVN